MALDTMTIRRGKATMKLVGFGKLYKQLQNLSDNALEEAKDILTKGAQSVYNKSQSLVPVAPEDGGELKASGKFSKARVMKKSGKVSASVTYGGPRLARLAPGDNPLYAIVQHENLSLKHAVGQAKFLEMPALEEKPKVMTALGKAIMKAAKKG